MPDSYLDEYSSRNQPKAPVLTADNLDTSVQQIKDAIEATGVPYSNVYKSTLGGPSRGSVMITVSIDPKESWANGILENSRYFHMSLGYMGDLKQFSGHVLSKWTRPGDEGKVISKPFRKTTVKSVDEAIAKITKYLKEITAEPKKEYAMPTEAELDPADVYHDTILDFLMDKFGSDRSAQDSANIAMYWFSDDYKSKSGPVSGELQLASLFKLMSGMDYQPDPNVRSIRDVPNDLAKDMYATLEEEFRAGEDGVFGEIRKLLEPVATDDEQYDDIKSAIEDEIESQANAHAAEAWSTPTDDMTDEHGEDIFLLADFGDWIAVNGDLHLGGPVPTPPEGFRSVNVGGRVPTTEEEVSMDSVIDQVAKTLKIDRARVQAVADEEGYGELTYTSVSGEVEAYANPKNKETPEEEALRSAPSRSNIIGREKGLERLQ